MPQLTSSCEVRDGRICLLEVPLGTAALIKGTRILGVALDEAVPHGDHIRKATVLRQRMIHPEMGVKVIWRLNWITAQENRAMLGCLFLKYLAILGGPLQ